MDAFLTSKLEEISASSKRAMSAYELADWVDIPVTDELSRIRQIQRTCTLRYERIGAWQLGGNYEIPTGRDDSDSDEEEEEEEAAQDETERAPDPNGPVPPSVDATCIGHAPNGDLFCAVRENGRGSRNEVWLFDHERNQLQYAVAESIAAFAFMAALDTRMEAGPQYLGADDAYEAKWEAELARDLAILDGRVSPPWMFLGLRRDLPASFVRYVSHSDATKAVESRG